MIEVKTNLLDFDKQLDVAMAELEVKMSYRFTAFTKEVYKSIVMISPQWSGNLTSNWNYSAGLPDLSYTEIPEKKLTDGKNKAPFEMGSDPAVSKALTKAAQIKLVPWRSPVYITNTTPEEKGGYLVNGIADGSVKLRAVNLVPSQVSILSFTVEKFKGAVL